MTGLLASKTCRPSYGGTSAVNFVWSSTVTTVGMPAALQAVWSSSPKAGAQVDDAGAVLSGHEVGRQHLVGVRAGRLDQEVEQRRVPAPDQLGPGDGAGPGPAGQVLLVVAQPGLADVGPLAVALKHGVRDVGSDGQGEVGRQRPRRGGPDRDPLLRPAVGGHEVEPHRQRLVLPVAVDVVHPGLGVAQRRLAPPAVRQHPEPLVDETLVVQGLEGPHDALHVGQIERLVVVGEVDPAGLPGDVALPVLGVLQHRRPARLVELVHARDRGSPPLVDRPSCFSASTSAGRPWQSQPKRRSTRRPRMVW